MKLQPGQTHSITYIKGNLYLNGILIAEPGKDVRIEFAVASPVTPETTIEVPWKEVSEIKQGDSSILGVNVNDKITTKDVGPGQK